MTTAALLVAHALCAGLALGRPSALGAPPRAVGPAARRATVLATAPGAAPSELPLPPGKARGPLRGVRETLAYLKDPIGFVRARVEEFGPVFSTTMFFRPTVVVGGPSNVDEFLSKEAGLIEQSSLPPIFTELHTEWGALNLQGAAHMAARQAYAPLLSQAALVRYLPTVEARVAELVARAAAHEGRGFAIAAEAKPWAVQLYAELFVGEQLEPSEVQLLLDYNDGLLALGRWSRAYRKGRRALQTLRAALLERLARARSSGALESEPRYHFFRALSGAVDERGEAWPDERIASVAVLFVWGAYAETAALFAETLVQLAERPLVAARVRAEAEAAGVRGTDADADAQRRLAQWDSLAYTSGVLKECLRTQPPTGGGFRLASADLSLGGYRVPQGWVVSADPRVQALDPDLFPAAEQFEPERWVKASAAAAPASASGGCPFAGSAAALGRTEWFPGGTGRHACPGVPLSELVSKVFLASWALRFESWAPADGVPTYVPVPIRMVDDSFTLTLTERAPAARAAPAA